MGHRVLLPHKINRKINVTEITTVLSSFEVPQEPSDAYLYTDFSIRHDSMPVPSCGNIVKL